MKVKTLSLSYLLFVFLCFGCGSNDKNKPEKVDTESDNYTTEPRYNTTPYYPTSVSSLPSSNDIDVKMSEDVIKVSTSNISKEYQEGYDQGYEDGEDDALSRNGYEGQYDDSCRYKGKKRKDYEEGYAEGYEAGYYDNVADDGSDEEYE